MHSSGTIQTDQTDFDEFSGQESVSLLRELKVRWVLVDPTPYCNWNKTQGMIERFGLSFEAQPGGMAVFTLQVEK